MSGIFFQWQVTFSEFSCTAMDYEALTQGVPSFPKGTGPQMKFSKPYNILRAEDRINLIEPLLKLGFLQSTLWISPRFTEVTFEVLMIYVHLFSPTWIMLIQKVVTDWSDGNADDDEKVCHLWR